MHGLPSDVQLYIVMWTYAVQDLQVAHCMSVLSYMRTSAEEHLSDPKELLNLLQLNELKTLCKDMKLPGSMVGSQKAQIVESLFRHSRQHRPLFGKATFLGAVVKR